MNPRSIDGLKIAMVAAVGGCAMAIAAVAIGHGLSSWTETGGGTPAPPRPPRAAVKLFNPETTTIYADQDEFLAAVSCRTVSLESFEEVNATGIRDTSTLVLDDIVITTDNPPQLGVWDERFQGAYATDGEQWVGIEEHALVTPHVTTLTFDVMITHLGINTTDFGDFGDSNLEFANEIGDVATAAFSGQPSGNHQFFGIINTARAFRTVTLTHSAGGEFYGIDEISYCWGGRPDAAQSRRSAGRVSPD